MFLNWNNLFSDCNEHVWCESARHHSSQTLQEGPQFKIAWGPENENSPLPVIAFIFLNRKPRIQ